MERQMSINEEVVRFMTLRVDELDEEPSVMVRPARRDDRRDDRGGDRGGERRDRDDRGRDDRPRDDRPRRARSAEEVQ
jgi:small subunit ribosomal protein S6